MVLRYAPHLSPHTAGAQRNRHADLLGSGEAHTVVAKSALPAATVHLLAAVHGQGGVEVPLQLAQSNGRGLGVDGTKDSGDANDDEGADARDGAAPHLVVNENGSRCKRVVSEKPGRGL